MKTIQGKNAAVTTTTFAEAEDVNTEGAIALPTQARLHNIVSDSDEDDYTSQYQQETATVGEDPCDSSGNATVTVTADGMTGTPKDVLVALTSGDVRAEIAEKIRAALAVDANVGHEVTGFFVVSGSGNDIVLTKKTLGANDSTLNIAIAAGTTGITAVPTSANTTPGTAKTGAQAIEISGIDQNLNEITEVIYMNGKNNVSTKRSYSCINSMRALFSNVNVGNITATAVTDNTVTNRIIAGIGESQQALYMLPKGSANHKVGKIYMDKLNATAAAITTIYMLTKEHGRAWVCKRQFQLSKEKPSIEVAGDVTIPEKSMIKFMSSVSAGSSNVNIHFTLEEV